MDRPITAEEAGLSMTSAFKTGEKTRFQEIRKVKPERSKDIIRVEAAPQCDVIDGFLLQSFVSYIH